MVMPAGKGGDGSGYVVVDISKPEGAKRALEMSVEDIDNLIAGWRTLMASLGELRRHCRPNEPVDVQLLELPIRAGGLLASESAAVAVNVVGLLSTFLARMKPLPDGPKSAT